MTDLPDLKELREAISRATPGPWSRNGTRQKWSLGYGGLLDSHTVGPDDWKGWIALIPYSEQSHAEDYANARYIALANPAAVSALIDRIEELEATLAALSPATRGGEHV